MIESEGHEPDKGERENVCQHIVPPPPKSAFCGGVQEGDFCGGYI